MGLSRWAVNEYRKTEHTKKVLLCIWWDQEGVIHYELLRQDQTATAELYQQQLIRVNDALEEKRPFIGSGRRKVILLQDNARPYTAKNIVEIISDLHRLGNSLLCGVFFRLSSFGLFILSPTARRHHLTDSQFKSVEEVEKSLDEFINSKPPPFFRSGIRQLPERWKPCINGEEDYFEDWVCVYSCFYK